MRVDDIQPDAATQLRDGAALTQVRPCRHDQRMRLDVGRGERREERRAWPRARENTRHVDFVSCAAEPAREPMKDPLKTTELRGSDDMEYDHRRSRLREQRGRWGRGVPSQSQADALVAD